MGRAVTDARPFLFIVGSGRSGTTLMRAMFNAHPALAVMHEGHVVAALARHRKRYEAWDERAVAHFTADLFDDVNFRRIDLPRNEVAEVLRSPLPLNFSDAIRRVFSLYAKREGKPRYGDKTPGYVLAMPLLGKLFPEAMFVHVIRDGRDVATAFSDVSFGPHNVAEAAIYWRRRVRSGRRAGRNLGLRRYCEVRYDDLVDEPERVLRRLCSFVDLSFDPAMLRYFERPQDSVVATGIPQAHQRLLLPPTAGLRQWRDEMPTPALRIFETLAGDALVQFGYERALPAPSPRDRIDGVRRWAQWQARRVRYNARMRGNITLPRR